MNCDTCGAEAFITCNGKCGPCYEASQEAWQKKLSVRQDPSQFDMDKLVRLLLTQHWMHECAIIPDYMPPHPHKDTRPTCQVWYTYPDGARTGLRYSAGPLQGYFWDMYGADFHSPELALIALSQAPAPPRVSAVILTHGK